jgi:hypothetical protein
MRTSRLQKKKAARKKWSQNANAKKIRLMQERTRCEEIPHRHDSRFCEWEVTIKNRLDGDYVRFVPASLNDLKKRASVIFAHYVPAASLRPGQFGS